MTQEQSAHVPLAQLERQSSGSLPSPTLESRERQQEQKQEEEEHRPEESDGAVADAPEGGAASKDTDPVDKGKFIL